MTGVFLAASEEIFSFPYNFEFVTLFFYYHSTLIVSDSFYHSRILVFTPTL